MQVEIPSLLVDLVFFHFEPGLVSLLSSRSERIFNAKLIVWRRSALIDLRVDSYPISVVILLSWLVSGIFVVLEILLVSECHQSQNEKYFSYHFNRSEKLRRFGRYALFSFLRTQCAPRSDSSGTSASLRSIWQSLLSSKPTYSSEYSVFST